jgi:hypothetical protein
VDDSNQTPPEVTIEPADNGFVVRHYQRGGKKDESGRTIRRVASSVDDALEHARSALGGTGKAKSTRRKPVRDGQSGTADAGVVALPPAAHSSHASLRGHVRRHPRIGGRR